MKYRVLIELELEESQRLGQLQEIFAFLDKKGKSEAKTPGSPEQPLQTNFQDIKWYPQTWGENVESAKASEPGLESLVETLHKDGCTTSKNGRKSAGYVYWTGVAKQDGTEFVNRQRLKT